MGELIQHDCTPAAFGNFVSPLQTLVTRAVTEKRLHPRMMGWLENCPDPSGLVDLMEEWRWLAARVRCAGCGEKAVRVDLRYDIANPSGGDEGYLVCHDCWDGWQGGTVEDPNYRPPAWPETFHDQEPDLLAQRKSGFKAFKPSGWIVFSVHPDCNGMLARVDASAYRIPETGPKFPTDLPPNQKVVGIVHRYNSRTHTGHVSLFGMEDCAEYGSLDKDCHVLLWPMDQQPPPTPLSDSDEEIDDEDSQEED